MHPRQPPSRIARHAAHWATQTRFPLKCYADTTKTHAQPSPHLSTQPVISFKQPDSTFLTSTVDHVLPHQPHAAPEDPARCNPSDDRLSALSPSTTFQIPPLPPSSLLFTTPSFQALQTSASLTSLKSTASTCGDETPSIRSFEVSDDLQDSPVLPELSLSGDSDSSVGCASLESSPGPQEFLDLDIALSYCDTPATSVPASPESTPATRHSLLTPSSQDDIPIASSWGSVDDVHDMLSQLEKVASELRMMDTEENKGPTSDYLTPTSFPPSFDDDDSPSPYLGVALYSSSNISQAHSIAYLRDDQIFAQEEFLHPGVPKIIITAPSTEDLLSSGNYDSLHDSESESRKSKGPHQNNGLLSPESAKDLSRYGCYFVCKRESSYNTRPVSFVPFPSYTPPSELLSRPPPQISSLEPGRDSYVPPAPLPPMTSIPEPFPVNTFGSETLPGQRTESNDHATNSPHPALWMCQLISDPIVHHGSKKRLKDKQRLTVSSPSLRASIGSQFGPSPSLNLTEIKSLLANSYRGGDIEDTHDSPSDARSESGHKGSEGSKGQTRSFDYSLTICWSEESLVCQRKTSRWKAFKKIFKRKK